MRVFPSPALLLESGRDVVERLLALAGLVLVAPLLAVIAAAIWLTMRNPVLFRQVRLGFRGRPFVIFKFRTMTPGGAKRPRGPGRAQPTRLGRFLRAASLDELPQLWNVVKGDMRLVGPRPLVREESPLHHPEHARRYEVKPGITGWAQVNGRNSLLGEDKFRNDVWYVDHRSLWLDIKILALTLVKVCLAEGIEAGARQPAPALVLSANGGFAEDSLRRLCSG